MNRRTFLGALLALPAAFRARPAAAKPKPWTQLIIGHPIEFRAERRALVLPIRMVEHPSFKDAFRAPPELDAKSSPTTITLGDGTVVSIGDWRADPVYETIAIRARPRWWRRFGRRHAQGSVHGFTTGRARPVDANH